MINETSAIINSIYDIVLQKFNRWFLIDNLLIFRKIVIS